MSVITVDCAVDIWTDIIAQQETKLRNAFDRGGWRGSIVKIIKMLFLARQNVPCILHLRNVHALGVDANTGQIGGW